MAAAPDSLAVPVPGGELFVGRWPGHEGAPVVVAAHGITANHASFAAVARELQGRVDLVAPDLRGRGRSAGVGPPHGITAHADDVVRILDHLGVDRATVVGHSMGGWVVANAAVRHPDRIGGVVAVDGGVGGALPEGTEVDVEAVLLAVLGPSMERLAMRFDAPEAYRDFWRQHPAVGGDHWSDDIEDYVAYDCVPDGAGRFRSSVDPDVVKADATEQLTTPEVGRALESVTCPAVFLRAPRGLLDGDPLFATPVDTRVPVIDVPDTNHFTIVLGPGAAVVADEVTRLAGVPQPTLGVDATERP